ncbi:NADPH:quinone reductase [Cyanobacteria bacterium FACHB-471]|nr:NADPH:quinone reductase [Cyanobacteria bacterium FACHB-471]
MQAAWYEQQGAARDVIHTGEMQILEPAANEVRVKVYASGVNPSDTKSRSGWGGITLAYPRVIPHQDGSGIVESVGAGVSSDRIGERVWIYEAQLGRPFGTAAEFVVVPSDHAIPLPENTQFVEGACLGVPAMTAHRCLFADGSINGQTILVTGGAGAVGYYAVQLAKWGGAMVITTVSRPEQADLVRAVGVDHVINYKTENVIDRIQTITGQERGIDRIVDVDLSANLDVAASVLKPNSSVNTYNIGSPDNRPAIPAQTFLVNGTVIRFVLVYVMPEIAKQDAIRDITAAIETKALQHNIAKRFSLSEVAAAHEAQDSGKLVGKAIVEIN